MPSYEVIQNHHRYSIQEVNYGGRNRGITVIVRPDGTGNGNRNRRRNGNRGGNNNTFARNNSAEYRLDENSNPHDLDCNWYIDNFADFYTRLGTAVADDLEANNSPTDWTSHINWPNSIHARIHRNNYSATKV